MEAPTNFPSIVGGDNRPISSDRLLARIPQQQESVVEVKPVPKEYANGALFTLLGLSTLALIFLVIRRLQSSKKLNHRFNGPPFSFTASCTKCRFFSRNPFLNCAVHPHKVRKIDAKDCPDFWPLDRDEFHQK